MSVKYTNFVEININRHISTTSSDLRNTACAIFYDASLTGDDTQDLGKLTKTSDIPAKVTDFEDYITAFFKNGGQLLHCIVTKIAPSVTTGTAPDPVVTSANSAFTAIIDTLPMEEIMVGFAVKPSETTYGESDFRLAAKAYNEAHATEKIYQKIFVSEIKPNNTGASPSAAGTVADLANYKSGDNKVVNLENYVLKYGALGIGASVLAYYTQINIYAADSTEDYCYTKEKYEEGLDDNDDPYNFVFDDNTFVKLAMQLDINVDINLSNSVRVIGGNDTAGYSLTNQYMLLVMHQTLTMKLINLLTTKIKYNAQGLGLVLNVISAELNKYVNNGFLSTNKTWTDGDLYYDGYLIVNDNTLLNLGYKVSILPFESLTPSEIEARQLPKIYILIADTYSIRKIVVNGELF